MPNPSHLGRVNKYRQCRRILSVGERAVFVTTGPSACHIVRIVGTDVVPTVVYAVPWSPISFPVGPIAIMKPSGVDPTDRIVPGVGIPVPALRINKIAAFFVGISRHESGH